MSLVEQELLTLPEHLNSPLILVGFVLLDPSFICMFWLLLFVLLYFFFWSLCCLFFFYIQFLIAPLVSSNSSFIIDYLSYEHNFSYIDWLLVICMDNLIEATSCIVFPKLGTGEDFKSWIHGVVKYFLRSRRGDALSIRFVR